MNANELQVHVAPTWDGKWDVLDTPEEVRRYERFWRWYWPCVGRWVDLFTFGLLWRE